MWKRESEFLISVCLCVVWAFSSYLITKSLRCALVMRLEVLVVHVSSSEELHVLHTLHYLTMYVEAGVLIPPCLSKGNNHVLFSCSRPRRCPRTTLYTVSPDACELYYDL